MGICTRGRKAQLRHLLHALAQQSFPDIASYCLIIIDNNDAPTVTQADLGPMTAYPWHIVHQPTPGLVSARNTLLEKAEEIDVDWQIGLDDDVVLEADWLANFVALLSETTADIIVGATRYTYPPEAHPIASGNRVKPPVMGQPPKRKTTCNYAMARHVFDKDTGLGLRFDPYFNEMGGEDVDLMVRAKRIHDLDVIGDPRPAVSEPQTGKRATLRHRLHLSAEAQVTTFRIKQRHKEIGIGANRLPMWANVLLRTNRDFVYGLGDVAYGLCNLPFRRDLGWRHTGLGLLQLARCVGSFQYLKGHIPKLYGQ
ncbi:MAG: glycosyltransferase family A protein [Pseudomonadota bacterium]